MPRILAPLFSRCLLAILVFFTWSEVVGCGGVEISDEGAARSSDALFLDRDGNVCEPDESTWVPRSGEGLAPAMFGCLKLEGDDIGIGGLTVDYNGLSIAINGWMPKEDSPGEYIGFDFSADGQIDFVVKAGGKIFIGAGHSWVHPAGTSGPEASGISFVAFCDEIPGCDDSGCCEEDDPDQQSDEEEPIEEEPIEEEPIEEEPVEEEQPTENPIETEEPV